MSITNIVGLSGILTNKKVNTGVGKNGEYISVELTLRTDEASEHSPEPNSDCRIVRNNKFLLF